MPVDANRHYRPGVLDEGVWACPSCGVDNAGPIGQGCASCGAGRPGHRATPDTPAPTPPARPAPAAPREEFPSLGQVWARQHAQATPAEAYDAGYQAGLQAAREAVKLQVRGGAPLAAFHPAGRMTRTLIAALTLFRDQVLVEAAEEIALGEWATADEVTALVAKLQQEEAARA
jgi:hypothetical protein